MSRKDKGRIKPSYGLPGKPAGLAPLPSDPPIRMSFVHLDKPRTKYCLSLCSAEELCNLSDAIRRATTVGFREAARNSGLRWKQYPDEALEGATRPAAVNPDWPVGAFRASQPFRVFGAREGHILHVLWFDREHKIIPTDF